jgi:hypothetical protein
MAAVLVLGACGGGGSTAAQSDIDQPAGNNPGQQQDSGSGSDSGTDSSDASASISFVRGETCHTKKLAGGNSDALFEFETAYIDDGARLAFKFTSSKQGDVIGEGIVKDGKVFVRVPVVAFGEELTLASVQDSASDEIEVQNSPDPLHTVPGTSGSECDLDDVEAGANGTINQPNPANGDGVGTN